MPEHIICDLCNKSVHKKSIKRHQQSKNCLNNINKSKEISCKYCGKQFDRLDNKNKHEESCKYQSMYYKYQLESKENEIIYLKESIKSKDNELKSKDNELKSKDNEIIKLNEENKLIMLKLNTINIINNNYININIPQDINDNLKHLNYHFLIQGGVGIARFLMAYPLKNKIKVNDTSRKKISYKLDDKIIHDNKCNILITQTIPPIREKCYSEYSLKKHYIPYKEIEVITQYLRYLDMIKNKQAGYDRNEYYYDIANNLIRIASDQNRLIKNL